MHRPRFAFAVAISLLGVMPLYANNTKKESAAGDDAAGTVAGSVATDDKRDALIVVYLEKVPGHAKASEKKVAKVSQRGSQFRPRAVVVTKGSRVDFPNEDKFFHNVFSVTEGNEFDLGMYRGGGTKSAVLEEAGEVEVFCNIHPDMEARVLVVENDFFIEAKDGAYSLEGVPPGSYKLIAWSSAHMPEKQDVTVTAGQKVRADFKLKPREHKGHMNKHGEQYGRYK